MLAGLGGKGGLTTKRKKLIAAAQSAAGTQQPRLEPRQWTVAVSSRS